jgi:hypothetical protein
MRAPVASPGPFPQAAGLPLVARKPLVAGPPAHAGALPRLHHRVPVPLCQRSPDTDVIRTARRCGGKVGAGADTTARAKGGPQDDARRGGPAHARAPSVSMIIGTPTPWSLVYEGEERRGDMGKAGMAVGGAVTAREGGASERMVLHCAKFRRGELVRLVREERERSGSRVLRVLSNPRVQPPRARPAPKPRRGKKEDDAAPSQRKRMA